MGRPERVVDMAPGFSARTDYHVDIKPAGHRLRAVFNGQTVADSASVLTLSETRHAATYYFPKSDVNMDLLTPTSRRTYCPFKGNASYWSLQVGEKREENCVWAYEEPYHEAAEIAGYVAFYWDKLDAWYEDDIQVYAKPDSQSGLATNPLVDWLLTEAWEASTTRELTHRLVGRLNEHGMQIQHMNVIIRTLHPLLAAMAYRWSGPDDEVAKYEVALDVLTKDIFTNSPVAPIFEGEGGIRRKINSETAKEYPILNDLMEVGATDYMAMPMRFSDGQINAVTMATDAPGGFSTQDLGFIHEILPLLSRLYEVHSKHRAASTLMQTFLGKHTGQRVLDGQIRRGDSEDMHAVIWFSDLRNSTPLAESMSKSDYLNYLNLFFDGMAGAVVDNGGEILQFNGDAVLAIFPIHDEKCQNIHAHPESSMACESAIKAAKDTISAISTINSGQRDAGKQEINFGIGIHMGDLTYGNIGIPERMQFTGVGAAANESARIESMTKKLGVPVLISSRFAATYKGDLKSVGHHKLRGVDNKNELFTLP